MKSKEGILEVIKKAGKKGVGIFDISRTKRRNNANYILTKQFLEDLLNEGKIEKRSTGKYVISTAVKRKRLANYITRDELERVTKGIHQDIASLNDKVDRAFEYIDEVFLNMRTNRVSGFPAEKDMLIAYDNVNRKEKTEDFVPIPDFKKELSKMGFNFTDKDINTKLLEMDGRGVIHLHKADNPKKIKDRKKGIKAGRKGLLFYIVWAKRV